MGALGGPSVLACAAIAWATCFLAVPAAAERLRQPVVMHQKVRHSALLAAGSTAEASRKEAPASLVTRRVATATAAPPADGTASTATATAAPAAGAASTANAAQLAKEQFKMLQRAQRDANSVVSNANTERDLLQTQLLANGESLHVIKSLADTIAKMKVEVEKLENHEKLCRKRVADLENSQLQRAEADRLADSVQVIR
uniref:Uncharacterized protein n=1 Tax=Alexandrium andersonii TaxID=327968 RepID=A0A7S2HGW3_9DINO